MDSKKRQRYAVGGSIAFHAILLLVLAFSGIFFAQKNPPVIEVQLLSGGGGGGAPVAAKASAPKKISVPKVVQTVVPPDSIMQYVEEAEKVFTEQVEEVPETPAEDNDSDGDSDGNTTSGAGGTGTGEGTGNGSGSGTGEGSGTGSGSGDGHGSGSGSGYAQGPIPVYQPYPRFPSRAIANNEEARFNVQLTIDARGRVTDVTILSSNVPSSFARAAEKAFYQWEFKPALDKNKRPMVCTTSFPVVFRLDD